MHPNCTKFRMGEINDSLFHCLAIRDLACTDSHTVWVCVCINVCEIPHKNELKCNIASQIWPLETQNLSEICYLKCVIKPGMDKVQERGPPLPGNDKENWGNHQGKSRNKWTFSEIKKFKISSKLWWLQLHIWCQVKGPIIIFHLRSHAVKLKCVDYKIF